MSFLMGYVVTLFHEFHCKLERLRIPRENRGDACIAYSRCERMYVMTGKGQVDQNATLEQKYNVRVRGQCKSLEVFLNVRWSGTDVTASDKLFQYLTTLREKLFHFIWLLQV